MPAGFTEGEKTSAGDGRGAGPAAGFATLAKSPGAVAFVVLSLFAVLPLAVSRYLPFCDLNGAEGLLGAWAKASDPSAQIGASFDIHVRPLPNALFYAVGRGLVTLFSAPVAANVYLAVFCVWALPLALLYTLRSFGRPGALALLAFPVIYHRCVWYGFVGSATAVPLLVLSWGFANRAFVAGRWRKEHAWLAVVFLLLATAHGFLVLVGGALLASWIVLAGGGVRRMARNAAVLVPGGGYLVPWLTSAGERSGSAGSFVGQLISRSDPKAALGRTVQWFIDGYAGHVDEALALVFVVTLVVVWLRGAGGSEAPSPSASSASRPSALWRWRAPMTAVCLGAGYVLLPMNILKPVDWWAVHVRLLVPFTLCLVLLVPREGLLAGAGGERRASSGLARLRVAMARLPLLAVLAPLTAATLGYFIYMAADFRFWYRDVETKGFDEVVAALPDAPHVLALWPDFPSERHYAHFPMAHLATVLLGEKGGRVTPVLGGLPKDMWVVAKPEPVAPVWGLARAFRWERHAAPWDYFLVKRPAPGNGTFPLDWPGNFPVDRVAESGLWSLWKKRPLAP